MVVRSKSRIFTSACSKEYEKGKDMSKKLSLKEFILYCSSNVFGKIGVSIYILADTFFVATGLGTNGLAALNIALPIYGFIRGIGIMFGMGGSTKYSIYMAQNEKQKANTIFTSTTIISLIFSLFYVLLGIFLSPQISTLLGANQESFAMTNIYIKTLLLGAPIFIMSDMLIYFVRNDKNPKLSMLAMLGSSMSNILLDYVFMFELNMGIFGAVFATVVSSFFGLMILSLHFLSKKNNFKLVKEKISFKEGLSIITLGFPSLTTELSSSIVMIVFNLIILSLLGNVGIASYGIVANLSFVVGAIFVGIAQGLQPLASKAYGANDKPTLKRLLNYSLITASVLSLLMYLVIFFLSSEITHLFNSEDNPLLQDIAVTGLKLYFIAIFFMGANPIMATFFASTEKAIGAHIISLLRGLIVIIPMAFLLANVAGIIGVWLSFPVSEGIVLIVALILLFIFNKKHKTPSLDNINLSSTI